jgi:hypothetical protein
MAQKNNREGYFFPREYGGKLLVIMIALVIGLCSMPGFSSIKSPTKRPVDTLSVTIFGWESQQSSGITTSHNELYSIYKRKLSKANRYMLDRRERYQNALRDVEHARLELVDNWMRSTAVTSTYAKELTLLKKEKILAQRKGEYLLALKELNNMSHNQSK